MQFHEFFVMVYNTDIFLLIAEFKVPDLAVWNPTRLFWAGQIPGAKKRKIHGEFLWIPFAIPRPPKWLYLFPKVFNVVQILGTRLKVRAIYKKNYLVPFLVRYRVYVFRQTQLFVMPLKNRTHSAELQELPILKVNSCAISRKNSVKLHNK